MVPLHSTKQDVLTSFIMQHYLVSDKAIDLIPKDIIVDAELPEHFLLQNVLKERSSHAVKLLQHVRGERKKWLEMANASAKQSLISQILNQAHMKDRFSALQNVLGLSTVPQRIECFDISHSSGEATVASCVVFTINGPLKSDYRRFNITNITSGDDAAAMHQAIQRRYHRLQMEHAILPDILMIDGGKIQLKTADNVLKLLNINNILLLSISKGPGRKPGLETLHFLDRSAMHLDSDSLALHLIQQIRDEAHRFAITGHRKQRDKKRHTSLLESIPGIGAKRRREILRYFGGIQAINHASLEELSKVPGINESLAKRIFEALHSA
jgi:excinuclease ABC subunit C